MRYIGNKENILDTIYSILSKNDVRGTSFFDFFAGTTNVSRYFKSRGYKVYSSDMLYLSYCLQKAYIENNDTPEFKGLVSNLPSSGNLFDSPLGQVICYLNSLPPKKGFIYNNYTPGGTGHLESPRMYFTPQNGERIDAIRTKIEEWKNDGLVSESEYYILLACLIETVGFYSNVAGVYAAYQKKWDARALKPLLLKEVRLVKNNYANEVYCGDSMELLDKINVDILYLDPPYNERQYAPNYHLLETIARYDNPVIKGVTGMRDYSQQKSRFCNPATAEKDLAEVAKRANYKFLVMSYNSEGIMPQERIIEILQGFGEVRLEEFEYARFKSSNQGLSRTKKTVNEQLYILKKR